MKKLSLRLLISIWALGLIGCASSKIIRDTEYQWTEAATKNGNYEKALEEFPKKETQGFITSVEKNWLRFWMNQGDVDELQRQVSTFENRKFLSVSREAQFFFYQESEDGYVPAEHEVIVLHLLSSMLFMQHQKWDEARVDAARAAYYLQGFFSEKQPHFDDPALRLWMAAVWAALGEWNEAQVDLRKITEMSNAPELKSLLERTKPPEQLSLVFSGVGPELQWLPGRPTPEFLENRNSPDSLFKEIYPNVTFVTKSTHPWFLRHQSRNSAIRDVLLESNYMVQFLGVKAGAHTERATGKVLTGALATGGVILGTALVGAGIYVAISVSGASEAASYIIGSGVLLGSSIWKEARGLDRAIQTRVDQDEKKSFESMRTYRFVRLMPEWISLGWGASLPESAPSAAIELKSPRSQTKVRFLHRP